MSASERNQMNERSLWDRRSYDEFAKWCAGVSPATVRALPAEVTLIQQDIDGWAKLTGPALDHLLVLVLSKGQIDRIEKQKRRQLSQTASSHSSGSERKLLIVANGNETAESELLPEKLLMPRAGVSPRVHTLAAEVAMKSPKAPMRPRAGVSPRVHTLAAEVAMKSPGESLKVRAEVSLAMLETPPADTMRHSPESESSKSAERVLVGDSERCLQAPVDLADRAPFRVQSGGVTAEVRFEFVVPLTSRDDDLWDKVRE